MSNSVLNIRNKIKEKEAVIENVPQLRKELRQLRRELEQAEALELLEVMKEKGVTVPDVRAAVEKGIVKSSAVKSETVAVAVAADVDRNEKEKQTNTGSGNG
ncbi:hypothetical protein FACS1894133_5880 [Clostridia bacterium]|nr:hypothetical protein FACS1894133_5880 [Clostridia bacterium]